MCDCASNKYGWNRCFCLFPMKCWVPFNGAAKIVCLSSIKSLSQLADPEEAPDVFIPYIDIDGNGQTDDGNGDLCCPTLPELPILTLPVLLLLLLLIRHCFGTKYQRFQSGPSKSAVPSQHSSLVPKPCKFVPITAWIQFKNKFVWLLFSIF